MNNTNRFMQRAVDIACADTERHQGKPFGGVTGINPAPSGRLHHPYLLWKERRG